MSLRLTSCTHGSRLARTMWSSVPLGMVGTGSLVCESVQDLRCSTIFHGEQDWCSSERWKRFAPKDCMCNSCVNCGILIRSRTGTCTAAEKIWRHLPRSTRAKKDPQLNYYYKQAATKRTRRV